MPSLVGTTIPTSDPQCLVERGFAGVGPAMYWAATTAVSSAVIATGFWVGYGVGGRTGNQVGLKVGDLFQHIQITTGGVPVKATTHVVIASTADQASTSASTGWGANYNVTIATAT